MNLALYGRVLWRFRFLVIAGTLLAVSLAILSMVRVTRDGIEYRDQEVWENEGVLLITQQGFPEGRALFPPETEPEPGEEPETYPYAGIGRFTSLVDLYAHIANSDPVEALIRRDGPIEGAYFAQPIPPAVSGGASPLLSLTGRGTTPTEATTIVRRATRALVKYVAQQQEAAKIPVDERVVVRVLTRAEEPVLVEGRKKTLPVIVLLAILSATVGLAFVLENARPAARPLEPVTDEYAEQRRLA